VILLFERFKYIFDVVRFENGVSEKMKFIVLKFKYFCTIVVTLDYQLSQYMIMTYRCKGKF